MRTKTKKRVKHSPLFFSNILGDLSPIDDFDSTLLPTHREVLRLFIHYHVVLEKDSRESAKLVVSSVLALHPSTDQKNAKNRFWLEQDVKNLFARGR